jgi:hypothetical protein
MAMAMARARAMSLEPNGASAANRTRPGFEPTDLQIVAPGELGVDVQLGMVRGPAATRVEVPDVEINLGLAPRVELDLDLTYALEGPFSAIHSAPDNAWLSSKIGLLDLRDSDTARTAWAFGVQLGPRLPMASGLVAPCTRSCFSSDAPKIDCTSSEISERSSIRASRCRRSAHRRNRGPRCCLRFGPDWALFPLGRARRRCAPLGPARAPRHSGRSMVTNEPPRVLVGRSPRLHRGK